MSFKPHVASSSRMSEFTLRALLLGAFLGIIFGVGNTYLGLKVGMTISTSIPAAVLSMAIMRIFFHRGSILENNMVQTVASVGGSIAGGVIFTAPALFILNAPPSIFRIFLLSFLGGILGVLFMIPMRRYIIVEEHGKLPFPEGTACAHILKSGEAGVKKAFMAVLGIAVGAAVKIATGVFHLWGEIVSWTLPKSYKTDFSIEVTPALLGVGYIIGPRIASILFAGGVLGWGVLIPLIAKFGTSLTAIFPSTVPIDTMTPQEIWSNYIRYIGAGTVGIGGLFSILKIFPIIIKTVRAGFKELFSGVAHRQRLPRTDQDISLRWLILGSLAILFFLWLFPGLPMNFLTILLLIILGFLFVAVTSITVGLVGSTSNPVSGMTISTLLVTCLIFVSLGWTDRLYLISALTMAIVANVAICLAGTTSQDLKTGYILGATPKQQQIGEILGIAIPAIAIAGTLFVLHKAYTFGSTAMPAPQATLMALIAKGVISGNIPLFFIMVGVVIGLIIALLDLPILAFAVGLYLPLSLSACIITGGIISWIIQRTKNQEAVDRGVLIASGLVAGDACTGVIVALFSVVGLVSIDAPPLTPKWVSLIVLLGLSLFLAITSLKKRPVR